MEKGDREVSECHLRAGINFIVDRPGLYGYFPLGQKLDFRNKRVLCFFFERTKEN